MATAAKRTSKAPKASKKIPVSRKIPVNERCLTCSGSGSVPSPSADEPRGKSGSVECGRCEGSGREPQHMHMAGRGCCPHPECVKGSSPKPRAAPKKPKEMTNEELVESQRQIENEIRDRKAAETKRANSQLGKLADALQKNSDLLDILAPTHAEETDTSFCSDVQAINGLSAKRLVPACARCVLLDLLRGKAPLNEVQFVARLHLARVHLARLS